jgi:coenzyme F420-reducing hydrogenase delta subunit
MNNQPAKIYIFCCATSYDESELARGINQQDIELKIISLPCSGKLDILYLTKAFDTGADGAVVMMCGNGECRYLEGNLRATGRAAAVGALLDEAGLGGGRIAVIQLGNNEMSHAIREVNTFCARIKNISQEKIPVLQSTGVG